MATITVPLNALIVPLSLAGLQAEPFWENLDTPALQSPDRSPRTTKIASRTPLPVSYAIRVYLPGCRLEGSSMPAVACAHDLGIQGEVVILSGDSGWKNMAKLSLI